MGKVKDENYSYTSGDIFPPQLMQIDDFNKWVNVRYYKRKVKDAKTAADVCRMERHLVTKLDLRIFEQYCQEELGEPLAGHDWSFYSDLFKISRLSPMTWTKNQLIEPCPTHLRVLFKGNVIITKEEISKDVILSNFLKRRKSSVPQS